VNGELQVSIKSYKLTPGTDLSTGTKVTVDSSKDNFTNYELRSFKEQLSRLSRIEDVNIILNTEDVKFIKKKLYIRMRYQYINDRTTGIDSFDEKVKNELNNSQKNDDPVEITLIPSKLRVEDYAKGISVHTLFNSLLVPSVSTKTIVKSQTVEESNYKDFTQVLLDRPRYVRNTEKSIGLFIYVGGIQIVHIYHDFLREDLDKGINVNRDLYSFIISLPMSTQLPVSRDDIIFNPAVSKLFEEKLLKLIDIVIAGGETKIPWDKNPHGNSLVELFVLLDKYAEYSKQKEIGNIVEKVYNITKNRKDVVFIPGQSEIYPSIQKHLLKKETNIKFILLQGVSLLEAETSLKHYLKDDINTEIYYGKNVVFIEDLPRNIDDGLMTSFIFINKDYTDKNPKYIIDLATSFTKSALVPHKTVNFLKDQEQELENFMNNTVRDLKKQVTVSQFRKIRSIVSQIYFSRDKFYDNFDNPRDGIAGLFSLATKYIDMRMLLGNISLLTDYNFILEYLTKIYEFYSNTRIYTSTYGSAPYIGSPDIENILPLSTNGGDKFKLVENYHTKFSNKSYYERLIKDNCKVFDLFLEGAWYTSAKFRMIEPTFIKDFLLVDQVNKFLGNKSNFDKIVTVLLDNSNSVIERIIVMSVLTVLATEKKISKLNNEGVKGLIIFTFQELRRRIDSNILKTLFLDAYTDEDDHLKIKLYEPLTAGLQIYIDTILNIRLPEIKISKIKSGKDYEFSAKKIVNYSFSNDIDASNVTKWATDIQNYQPNEELKLQTIEIAVNEGTTKGFVESIITEMTQNSIDAIRESNNKGDINVRIGMVGDLYAIQFEDNVGISLRGIFSILIPFLSTKSAENMLVTGEMGSGFFNVYRYPWSKEVIIQTYIDEGSFTISAIPDVKNKRVVDIDYKLTVSNSTRANNGTIITVLLNDIGDGMITLITDAFMFCRNYLGVIHGTRILVNGQKINQPIESAFDNDFGSIKIGKENSFISSLQTNGIPFSDLASYLKALDHYPQDLIDAVSTGYVVDIYKGNYTPVQSRNRIFLEPDKKLDLFAFLNKGLQKAMTLAIVKNYVPKSKRGNYIPNFNSRSTVSQLKMNTVNENTHGRSTSEYGFISRFISRKDNLTAEGIKKFNEITRILIMGNKKSNSDVEEEKLKFDSYKSLSSFFSIGEYSIIYGSSQYFINNYINIAEVINSIGLRESKFFIVPSVNGLLGIDKNLLTEYLTRDYTMDDETVELIYMWVSNKYKSKGGTATVSKDEKKKKVPKYLAPGDIGKIYKLYSKFFWSLGKELENRGVLRGTSFHDKPEGPIIYVESDVNYSGVYKPAEHIIVLNESNYNPIEMNKKLINVFKQEDIDERIMSMMKNFSRPFGTIMPTATLVHEMSHAWRRTSHNAGHDEITITIKGIPRIMGFDLAALEVYKLIIEEGLWAKIFEEF